VLLLLLALAAVTVAGSDLLSPPFTDAELEANQVDTWEAYVLGGVIILALLFGGFALSAIGVYLNRGGRLTFLAACVAFAAAFLIEVTNVELLTQRVERLVGHELSWI
jgi:hypothetical protein